MLLNYFKLSLRNFRKQRTSTLINVLGLSIGMACFLLIALHVVDEFSFDRFHSNKERLFRVVVSREAGFQNEPAQKDPYQPMPLGPALAAEFGDIESFSRVRQWGGFVQAPTGLFEEDMIFVDRDFLNMFSFKIESGDAGSALDEPQEVVLTEKTAQKLFGHTNVVGQTLQLKVFEVFESFTVSAVVANPPSNSSLQFQMLLPFVRYANSQRGKDETNRWSRISFQTYVLLHEGAQASAQAAGLQQFRKRHYPEEETEARQQGWWSGQGAPFSYALQPIQTMRHDDSVPSSTVSAKQVWGLLALGGLVLLIACANFTTLSLGHSASRALTTGVRKSLGANRWQLATQHLTEALLMSFCALALGFLVAQLALPFFNQLLEKDLAFDFGQFPELFWLLPALALTAGFLAGAYPSLVLSGFNPLDVFQKKIRFSGRNWFTQGLVTGQFVLAIGLTICMLVILNQTHFMRTQNPGFDKENVVVVNAGGTDNLERTALHFEQNFGKMPEVVAFSRAEMSLGGEAGQSVSTVDYQGKPTEIYDYVVDTAYIPTLGLTLLAGRNFNAAMAADTQTSVVINEAAMQAFGWTLDNAVGQRLTGYDPDRPDLTPTVIGVVKNYHFAALRDEIKPMMLQQFSQSARYMFFVRLEKGYPKSALQNLQNAWVAAEPTIPFNYQFLDESLDSFYKTEQRWSRVVSLAGGLSIFLACLGLWGLASLAALNRTKEIGIRKVLGASLAGITRMLTSEFLWLVLVALVLAAPVAYILMQKWLANFAYHIDIQWWMFAVAGLTAVGIAFLSVGFQGVKAALANPVKSLRNE